MELTNELVHARLAQMLYEAFGWTLDIEANDESGPWASVPAPGRDRHLLRFRSEPNSVEVSYDDSLPPGPAEILFVFEPHELEDALQTGVLAFVRELVSESLVVVRERRLRAFPLLFRTPRSSLRFMKRSDLTPRIISGALAIYSWNKTYDVADSD